MSTFSNAYDLNEEAEAVEGWNLHEAARAEAKKQGYEGIFAVRFAEAIMTEAGWTYSLIWGWCNVGKPYTR